MREPIDASAGLDNCVVLRAPAERDAFLVFRLARPRESYFVRYFFFITFWRNGHFVELRRLYREFRQIKVEGIGYLKCFHRPR